MKFTRVILLLALPALVTAGKTNTHDAIPTDGIDHYPPAHIPGEISTHGVRGDTFTHASPNLNYDDEYTTNGMGHFLRRSKGSQTGDIHGTSSRELNSLFEPSVLEACLSCEDSAEEDTSNIALCEDYYGLECNKEDANDCAILQAVYAVNNNGVKPCWSQPYGGRKLGNWERKLLVPEECSVYKKKSLGHCIAFMSIQGGTCCSVEVSKVCDKIENKFEYPLTKDAICSSVTNGLPTSSPSTGSGPTSFCGVDEIQECYCKPSNTDGPTKFPSSAPSFAPTASPTSNPTTDPSSPTAVCSGECYKYDDDTEELVIITSSGVCESGSFCVKSVVSPSTSPTLSPTRAPSSPPSLSPSKGPSVSPSANPTAVPTKMPSREPTSSPSNELSTEPSKSPTSSPSIVCSGECYKYDDDTEELVIITSSGVCESGSFCVKSVVSPSTSPTPSPTRTPTQSPSVSPSHSPTVSPSSKPSVSSEPSGQPSSEPSISSEPTTSEQPSSQPSSHPSFSSVPTPGPTGYPTQSPTKEPTQSPSLSPSKSPSKEPSLSPSKSPTSSPTAVCGGECYKYDDDTEELVIITSSGVCESGSFCVKSVVSPSTSPTPSPTRAPSSPPSLSPSKGPSVSPSANPTAAPTSDPTKSPTNQPTSSPSRSPSQGPSNEPSTEPSKNPTSSPSAVCSGECYKYDSETKALTIDTSSAEVCESGSFCVETVLSPSTSPTPIPTRAPSSSPSDHPTGSPSNEPTSNPSHSPTVGPSSAPSSSPTNVPSSSPTPNPTQNPTLAPLPNSVCLSNEEAVCCPEDGLDFGEVCSTSSGCPCNAALVCSSGTCKCPSRGTDIGDPCNSDCPCGSNTEGQLVCSSSGQCKKGTFYPCSGPTSTECGPGLECSSNDISDFNCISTRVANSITPTYVCKKSKGTNCEIDRYVGTPGDLNKECAGVLRCLEVDSETRQCFLGLGDSCNSSDSDCGPNLVCQGLQGFCKGGTGYPCSSGDDCAGDCGLGGLFCSPGTCTAGACV